MTSSDVDELLKGKYPAKAHCQKIAAYLKSKLPKDAVPTTIYLQGQQTHMNEDNDEAAPFRQRRHFIYLSGCLKPDCHLTYHIPSDTVTLFIPPLDPESVIWAGLPLSPELALKEYDVDECLPVGDLERTLSILGAKDTSSILAITGRGDLPFKPSTFKTVNTDHLHPALDDCRVTKDEYEVALLRKANEITTLAHRATQDHISARSAKNETELEATFIGTCIAHGAKNQAYHGIFGSGINAATLHYINNDELLAGRRNILIDAGAEWRGYCSDVTRTMPLNGTDGCSFDEDSAKIYKIVDRMQKQCFDMLRPGVLWEDVHLCAHKVAIDGLLEIGILKGDREAILKQRTSVAFYPHGLGHYLGLDTHDTGGNANYSDPDPMYRYLRVRGTLPERAVITVEPGLYFCKFIVEPYLNDEKHSQFIDKTVLDRFWEVGGVRIEDDVLITKDGYENLTTAPRTVGHDINDPVPVPT